MPRPLLAAAALLAAGCAPGGPADTDAPTLEITAPERGSIAGETLVVSGTARDDGGLDRVEVNGVVAELDGDSFRAEIALAPGTNLIETIAFDRADNRAADVRAALSGELAGPGPIADAFAIRLGPAGLAAVGDTTAAILEAAPWTQTIADANPVLDTGGSCLGARADLTSIELGDVAVDLEVAGGALAIAVDIADLSAGVHVDFDVACIGGRRDLTASADRATLTAEVELGVAGDSLVVDIASAAVILEGVDLGLAGFPTAIIDLIAGDLDDAIGDALTGALVGELEPLVEAGLAGLTGARTAELLGRELSIAVRPQSVTLDGGALELVATSEIRAAGAENAGYVATPSPAPALAGELVARFADDALNQALGALWASGALAREVELRGESGADLGAGIADSLSIDALLPPVVSFAGGDVARVEIGDLIARLGRGDESVSEVAVSARIDLTIGASGGRLRLSAEEPTLSLQRIGDGGFLTDRDLELLDALLSTTLRGDLDAVLGEMPLPQIAGQAIEAVAGQATAGYLTFDVALAENN